MLKVRVIYWVGITKPRSLSDMYVIQRIWYLLVKDFSRQRHLRRNEGTGFSNLILNDVIWSTYIPNRWRLLYRGPISVLKCQNRNLIISWGRHQMETFSALLALCEGNSPVTGVHVVWWLSDFDLYLQGHSVLASVLSCLLYGAYNSEWIVSIFGRNDHLHERVSSV